MLEILDSEVLLVLQVTLGFQVSLGFRGPQELQEIQDVLEPKVNKVNQEESLMQLAFPLWGSLVPQVPLVHLDLLGLQAYQVPLVLLACLDKLVLKVTGVTKGNLEYQ